MSNIFENAKRNLQLKEEARDANFLGAVDHERDLEDRGYNGPVKFGPDAMSKAHGDQMLDGQPEDHFVRVGGSNFSPGDEGYMSFDDVVNHYRDRPRFAFSTQDENGKWNTKADVQVEKKKVSGVQPYMGDPYTARAQIKFYNPQHERHEMAMVYDRGDGRTAVHHFLSTRPLDKGPDVI